MWLNAHCAIGRNDRRSIAGSRRNTAAECGLSISAGSDRNVVYDSRLTYYNTIGKPCEEIGMFVAEQCCMKPKTTVTTSTTRSA